MAFFDFPWWERVRADVELDRMPDCTAAVIESLLTNIEIEQPCGGHEQTALRRLIDFSLVEVVPPDWDDACETYRASPLLREIADRDLLPTLTGQA